MYIGSHISIQGGIDKSIDRALLLGCEAMQIFTTNPRSWDFETPSEKDVKLFTEKWKSSSIKKIVGHSIYLTNFASSNPYIYENSIKSLSTNLRVSESLGLDGYILHVGSHKGRGVEYGIERAIGAFREVLKAFEGTTPLLLENSAGAGDTIGRNFDELKSIIKGVGDKRLGICLDTAHAFESGYDMRTEKGYKPVMDEVDEKIGLSKLKVFHLNDSKTDLGSNVDRHENIGKGKIGEDTFSLLLGDPRFVNLPGILETPEDKTNIELLKNLRNNYER